jgi:hypothetical protein
MSLKSLPIGMHGIGMPIDNKTERRRLTQGHVFMPLSSHDTALARAIAGKWEVLCGKEGREWQRVGTRLTHT